MKAYSYSSCLDGSPLLLYENVKQKVLAAPPAAGLKRKRQPGAGSSK
jgi:hypothetical protein